VVDLYVDSGPFTLADADNVARERGKESRAELFRRRC
jgi:hypothetical protein